MDSTTGKLQGKWSKTKAVIITVAMVWVVIIFAILLTSCTGSPQSNKQAKAGTPAAGKPVYDTSKLPDVLLPLIVNASYKPSDLANVNTVVTRQGGTIKVTSSNGKLTLNDKVNIVGTEIKACNGVIYVIDQMVTLPTETPIPATLTATPEVTATVETTPVLCQDGQTIADILRADPRFSNFVLALDSMGYMDMLDKDGFYTVFAPPNDVFVAPTLDANGEKITICHATGSTKNPYVEITIDTNGLNGHKHHSGDIIPAPAGGCPVKSK
jgi:uncharacterized surface protein with fasciclin (FAS1) repeats